MLRALAINNYKSLKSVRLEDIPSFSVLVGANASGKSNFADALDFLSLTFRGGLAYAIRTKGGYENICFRRERRSKAAIEFTITAEVRPRAVRRSPSKLPAQLRYCYHFAFRATTEKIRADYRIVSEDLSITTLDGEALLGLSRGSEGPIAVSQTDAGTTLLDFPDQKWLTKFLSDFPAREDELFLSTTLRGLIPGGLEELLSGCRVYQISPHTARETGVPERSPELGRHGENLPAAVDYLRRTRPEAFDELLAHLRDTVPSMEKLETRYVETKQLGLFFQERGVGRTWFSQDVSDGTLHTISIFLPLLDPRVRIAVIEEPENSIHPWILRHFIESCRTHSGKKQIFLTTHSPVALSEVPVESLFIVTRSTGGTRIDRAARLHPEAIQVARENLLTLGEYWDSGALGGTPEPNLLP